MSYEHQGRPRCHVEVKLKNGMSHRSVLVDFTDVESANKWLELAKGTDVLEAQEVTHIIDEDNPFFDQVANAWKPSLTTRTINFAFSVHTIESITKATS